MVLFHIWKQKRHIYLSYVKATNIETESSAKQLCFSCVILVLVSFRDLSFAALFVSCIDGQHVRDQPAQFTGLYQKAMGCELWGGA